MSSRFGIFLLFFIEFFSIKAATFEKKEKSCPPLCPPHRGSVFCFSGYRTVKCTSEVSPGSIAKYRCQNFYELKGEKSLSCLSNGSWSSSPPKCLPECGRINPATPLIVNGVVSTPGAFPWHVAIYCFIDGAYEHCCGGSLVSEFAVLTAAHCVYGSPPENFILAFGKFHRDFDHEEPNVQKIKAWSTKMLETYQDVEGNYNGDLALIFLEDPVEFNQFTSPICLDRNQEFMDKQLTEETSGVVLGWGLTENDTFSDLLRILRLPVVSDKKCLKQQKEDFRKFVTYTSFCAGLKNGTGVCNGDSGGGLAFVNQESDRWYLQGLVSVSPRRRGTSFCDPDYYSVFTKVSMFMRWLDAIEETEEEKIRSKEGSDGGCAGGGKPQNTKVRDEEMSKNLLGFFAKYFNASELEIDGKKFVLPHSNKILKSAGLYAAGARRGDDSPLH